MTAIHSSGIFGEWSFGSSTAFAVIPGLDMNQVISENSIHQTLPCRLLINDVSRTLEMPKKDPHHPVLAMNRGGLDEQVSIK